MVQNNSQVASDKTKIRRSEGQIRDCLDEQEQSGLSAKEYCQANSISEKTFSRWVCKYRSKAKRQRKKKMAVKGGFASIEVVRGIVDTRPQLFAEIGNIRLYKEMPAEYLKMLLS